MLHGKIVIFHKMAVFILLSFSIDTAILLEIRKSLILGEGYGVLEDGIMKE